MTEGTWRPVSSDGPSPFYFKSEPADILEMLFVEGSKKPSGFRLRVGARVVEVFVDDTGHFPGFGYDDGKETVN